MATIKYNVGDVVRRKTNGKEYLIEKIELGYYTLSDLDCPSYFPSNDLSCSTVDNKNVYEFVRHMNKEEYKETMNRMLCN